MPDLKVGMEVYWKGSNKCVGHIIKVSPKDIVVKYMDKICTFYTKDYISSPESQLVILTKKQKLELL